MKIQKFVLGIILVLIAFPALSQKYNIVGLGTLDGESSIALSLNNRSEVVGYSGQQAFVWKNGQMSALAAPEETGGLVASKINDSSEIVGWGARGEKAEDIALLWRNRAVTVLPDPSIEHSHHYYAHAISNTGLIGGTYDSDWVQAIALWQHDHYFKRLDALTVTDINSTNQVVGRRIVDGREVPYIWSQGVYQDITIPMQFGNVAKFGQAEAVNDHSHLVGWYEREDGSTESFFWNGHNVVDMDPDPLGYPSKVYDVNDFDKVVGEFQILGGVTRPFLWSGIYQIVDLNRAIPLNSGWYLMTARGINDAGQIIGTGVYQGKVQGYILTPVPEVSTLAILGCAVLALVSRKKV